jgi:hypothetical protein
LGWSRMENGSEARAKPGSDREREGRAVAGPELSIIHTVAMMIID